MNFLLKNRFIRRVYQLGERCVPFFVVAISKRGLISKDGRTLIWGKFRRVVFSSIPGLPKRLQKHYGISGGCTSCGASCNLLFRCPHWDEKTHLCSVYEDRPNICRTFPITPADIRDRNLILKDKPCGFTFKIPTPQPPIDPNRLASAKVRSQTESP